jgi:SAM-dependent methyltransferase
MSRFGPDVHMLQLGERVALFHGRTGRHISLSREVIEELESWNAALLPPPGLRGLASRLEGLHMLRESRSPDLASLIPARSRRVILLPQDQILWHPIPSQRTAGGHRFCSIELNESQMQIWRGSNGTRSVREVSRHCGLQVEDVLAFLAQLTAPEVQAVQLRSETIRPNDASLQRLVCPERPPAERPAHLYGQDGATTLETFHQQHIADGSTHFDDVETTVAHAFALPHSGLGGEPYGARLHRALEERGMLPDDGDTLEIGGGDGELAEAWLRRCSERGRPQGELIRLDISPELLNTQARRLPGTRQIEGTATAIPLPSESLSLVICNEVMADLSAVPFDATTTSNPTLSQGLAPAVAHGIEKYDLVHLPGRSWYNLGAWQLVEQLARVLRPGGVAFLSEFGELDAVPQETTQLDHPEVSIHFGHLIQVARALGMEARTFPLAEFMDINLQSSWLSRHSYEALRARLDGEGKRLQARAWTSENLELPWPVEGLHWVSLADEGPGPLVTRFQVLILRKP